MRCDKVLLGVAPESSSAQESNGRIRTQRQVDAPLPPLALYVLSTLSAQEGSGL
jgi:hypothetical protein